jgi:hypothetical protein
VRRWPDLRGRVGDQCDLLRVDVRGVAALLLRCRWSSSGRTRARNVARRECPEATAAPVVWVIGRSALPKGAPGSGVEDVVVGGDERPVEPLRAQA